MPEIKLQDLKQKSPVEMLAFAESHEVENASTLRKQELMFAILKQLASVDFDIIGEGVLEVLQDGFGFLRSPDANYLAGPDDIYVSPEILRQFSLRYTLSIRFVRLQHAHPAYQNPVHDWPAHPQSPYELVWTAHIDCSHIEI